MIYIKMSHKVSPKGSLPDGWIVKTSQKHPDTVFYFNTNTGVSTWECPKLIPPRRVSESLGSSTESSKNARKRSSDSDVNRYITNTENLVHQISSSNSANDYSQHCTSFKELTKTDDVIKIKKCCNSETSIKNLQYNNAEVDGLSLVNVESIFQLSNQNSYENASEEGLSKSPQKDFIMLDLSKNLNGIDDLPEEEYENYFIVVDANILITDLNVINEIKDTLINSSAPHFFIPWVVIQELDNLRKKSPNISKASKHASEALKYIYHLFKAKHPRFHGQSPKQMKEWTQTCSKNNNDRILECCLNLIDRISIDKLILITNDINLSNKASIIDITVFDLKSFFELLKTRPVEIVSKASQQKKIDDIMLNVKQILKDVLHPFFISEMNKFYGGNCWEIIKTSEDVDILESLTSLEGILNAINICLKKFFEMHLKELKQPFEFLREVAERIRGFSCTREEGFSILNATYEIVRFIEKKWPKIEIPFIHLQVQYDSLKNLSKTNENYVTLNVLMHILTVMKELCGMVMDFYGIQHCFSYEKPAVFPSEDSIDLLICRLHPAVCRIKTYMSKIVIKNAKVTSVGLKFYGKFYQALIECVPMLDVEVLHPLDMHDFTVKDLQQFCQNEANQDKLLLVYNRLEKFYSKLEEVLFVMTRIKS